MTVTRPWLTQATGRDSRQSQALRTVVVLPLNPATGSPQSLPRRRPGDAIIADCQ